MRLTLGEACAHLRKVKTPRGSRLLLRQVSPVDAAYPKYPPAANPPV